MNIKQELQKIATHETCMYIKQHMRAIQSVGSQKAVHDRAVDLVTIDGLVLEFGVYMGNTINYLASKRDWLVDGFDSFEGLPEAWRDGFDRGAFAIQQLPDVKANVRLHKGWFSKSLPIYLSDVPSERQVAYLHIDCDLYSSTKDVLYLLSDRIKRGTVIVFDEYFNYDGWQHGEYLAFKEFVEFMSIDYDYITYNHNHEQCAVIIK